MKGTVKWEKKASERRASERTTKKPDRWGNNVMMTKVERESNDEEDETLPSVFEIKTPIPSPRRRNLLKENRF